MVKAIQIHPEGDERRVMGAVDVVADQGIPGDRHFGGESATQVTLIAEEDVAAFNDETMNAYKATDIGRNVVTSGIELNECVGKRLRIGSAVFEGIEPCHPCAALGARLAHYRMTAHEVVRGLRNRGGLRARVVESGHIEVGSSITAASPTD